MYLFFTVCFFIVVMSHVSVSVSVLLADSMFLTYKYRSI